MPGSLGPEVLGVKSSQRGQGLTLASQKSPVVSRHPPPRGGGWGLECLLRSHTWGTGSKGSFIFLTLEGPTARGHGKPAPHSPEAPKLLY